MAHISKPEPLSLRVQRLCILGQYPLKPYRRIRVRLDGQSALCPAALTRYPAMSRPALRSVGSLGPVPVQQPASTPSITTAGSVLTPYCLAPAAISGLFISSSTSTSHEEQTIRCTRLSVSAHGRRRAAGRGQLFHIEELIRSPTPA